MSGMKMDKQRRLLVVLGVVLGLVLVTGIVILAVCLIKTDVAPSAEDVSLSDKFDEAMVDRDADVYIYNSDLGTPGSAAVVRIKGDILRVVLRNYSGMLGDSGNTEDVKKRISDEVRQKIESALSVMNDMSMDDSYEFYYDYNKALEERNLDGVPELWRLCRALYMYAGDKITLAELEERLNDVTDDYINRPEIEEWSVE